MAAEAPVAFVIPIAPDDNRVERLKTSCRECLADFKVSRVFVAVDD